MHHFLPTTEQLESLTPAERDCLRLILDHRTAKEIAIELGITHHAVEKRLKRAREKLGAQSSVEAARWHAEHYGEAVYGASDLPSATSAPQASVMSSKRMTSKWRFGVMVVSSFAAIALLMGSQGTQNVQDLDPNSVAEGLERTLEQEKLVAQSLFERMDADTSGFLERSEFVEPMKSLLSGDTTIANLNGTIVLTQKQGEKPAMVLDQEQIENLKFAPRDKSFVERRELMFALLDRNEDDRVDRAEFTQGQLEGIGPRTFKIKVGAK